MELRAPMASSQLGSLDMIHWRYIERDNAFGVEYRFENANESIKEHQHPTELCHASLCLKGRALIEIHPSGTGEPQWLILDEGAEAVEPEFDSRLPHRIASLDAGTILFNRLYVRPDDAAELLAINGTME